MNTKKYVDKLMEDTSKSDAKKVVLQLNLEITEEEANNLNKLVKILKKRDSSITKKSICYGALVDSGIFNNI